MTYCYEDSATIFYSEQHGASDFILGIQNTNIMIKFSILLLVGLSNVAATTTDSFKWAGAFHLTADESPYRLSVTMPKEGDGVNEEANAHIHRDLMRRLEEDHEGHDHSSEYYFPMALVPVQETGQAGIDEAIELLFGGEDHDHDHEDQNGEYSDDHFFAEDESSAVEEEDHSDHDHFRMLQETTSSISIAESGDVITPSAPGTYELFFVSEDSLSVFSIELDANQTTEHFVLFFPAAPSQVESSSSHYLTNSQGDDVWPETFRVLESSSSSPEEEEEEKPWGTVIGAALLINLVTLIGVISLVPMMTRAYQEKSCCQVWTDMASSTKANVVPFKDPYRYNLFIMALTSFACGALLATAVFLIIPEAIILVNSKGDGEGEDDHSGHDHRFLQDDHDDHGDKTWVFGTCLLAGFLFPWVVSACVPHTHEQDPDYTMTETAAGMTDQSNANSATNKNVVAGGRKFLGDDVRKEIDVDAYVSKEAEEVPPGEKSRNGEEDDKITEGEEFADDISEGPAIDKRLVSAIIVGDALHNFCDGVFVGVGFLVCDRALAWNILASTIYHELAQELSDFFLLTHHAHLPPLVALVSDITRCKIISYFVAAGPNSSRVPFHCTSGP